MIDRSRLKEPGGWRPWVLPLGLLVAAAIALAIDCPLSGWCAAGQCPGFFRRLFSVFEPFGNGLGVLVIAAVIYQLAPHCRWALPRVLAMSLGAGLAANVVKMTIARTRPHHFAFAGDVWTTFGQWLPLTGADSSGQSMPSAHTATAVGLAVGLAWLFPRGRWLFAAMAVLVGCQRIQGGAHYPSDVLCGAALGYTLARLSFSSAHVKTLCEWLEKRWRPAPTLASERPERRSA